MLWFKKFSRLSHAKAQSSYELQCHRVCVEYGFGGFLNLREKVCLRVSLPS